MSQIRNYEAVVVLKNQNEEAQTVILDSIYSNLEKRGGEILQRENWGVKYLFHPSSGDEEGDFNFLRFNIIGDQVKNIYSELKLNTDILKIFISRVSGGK